MERNHGVLLIRIGPETHGALVRAQLFLKIGSLVMTHSRLLWSDPYMIRFLRCSRGIGRVSHKLSFRATAQRAQRSHSPVIKRTFARYSQSIKTGIQR